MKSVLTTYIIIKTDVNTFPDPLLIRELGAQMMPL